MDKYRGEMFYRGQPMSDIMAADYDRLKYFDGWSAMIRRADMKAYNDARNKKGR